MSTPHAAPRALLDARERAIRLLTDRYAEGAFGETELDARVARLHAARDAAGVEAVVHDLRDPLPTAPLAAPPVPAALPDAPAERRVLCIMSAAKRSGWWPMPRLLRVRAVMGDVHIDLRDAPIVDEVVVDVGCIMSNVAIVVPPGLSVRFELFATLGNAVTQAPDLGPGAMPRLVIEGSAFLGEVRVVVRERGR